MRLRIINKLVSTDENNIYLYIKEDKTDFSLLNGVIKIFSDSHRPSNLPSLLEIAV